MSRQSDKPKTVVQQPCNERNKAVADFFALLFRIDQRKRNKKSKEPVCNTVSAKSK
jgi:hypothetical protein